MEIKHVFFDLDHTLWDFEKNSDLTFQQIFRNHQLNIELDSFLTVYKPLNLEYWRLYREEKISKEALRYGRLKNTFDAINYTIPDALIHTIATDYINNLANFNNLFEGAFELLDYLKDKYSLHIITNGFEEIQEKKMANASILHYFEQIITSESVGVKKPNPRVFEHAMQISNATPDNSIMIGDSLEADIIGAQNVGMKTIHCVFDNITKTDKNFISVTNLTDIKNYL
ncbi:YjjG family noncanonical pyrimidine nucleotidase [Polaribacter tangerinus]|uniref:YjjG family noncanonical pyrimidine nucleotidase n=1 Tax=Polaribacter tangerinus TaxID=1920034 RepID=UPI000B4AC1ED|nr:YjjG family noncanonical pyrimidine nucleotidase [Polaribacter tangerinus]